MEVVQIASLLNSVTAEVLGRTDLIQEDLSNIVDAGSEIFDATSVENYGRTLMDHIGRMIFVDRVYRGSAPSVIMDSWEFGSVLEKVQADLPNAQENDTWKLENGQTYNQDIFYKPTYSAKFYNSKVTFEIPMSFTDIQLRSAFDNATQMNSFISMIYNAIEKSMTLKVDALIKRTLNNFIAETLKDEYPEADYSDKSGVRARNVLYEYNQLKGTQLTVKQALTNSDFLAYVASEMKLMVGYIGELSEQFNIEGKARFTPRDLLHFVLLNKMKSLFDTYLYSNTFHNEFVSLPNHETVSYWQAPGDNGYDFNDISSIDVIPTSGGAVKTAGIIGLMFDRDALGVSNYNRRTTSHYNARAEFTNEFFKMDSSYFNDFQENGVVFFMA